MSAKESVAIIGMGISGSATLTAYYNVSQAGELPVSLTCIDSQHFFGRGIPFAPDSKHALVNTRSSDLTYNQDQPGDYVDWLQAKLGQAQVPEYTSRQRFGQYQHEKVTAMIDQLKADVLLGQVTALTWLADQSQWALALQQEGGGSSTHIFDRIHLCCGDLPTADFYDLKGTPHYIHHPYPLHEYPQVLQGDQRAAVIGTSLSSIDIIKYLAEERKLVSVVAFSRSNQFPTVGLVDMAAPDYQYCTRSAFEAARQTEQGILSFAAIDHLIQAELSQLGLDDAAIRVMILTPGIAGIELAMEYPEEVAMMEGLATTVTRILYYLWQYVPESDRARFLEKYERVFNLAKNKMPRQSAEDLIELSESGRLVVPDGVVAIDYDEATQTYQLKDEAGQLVADVDWVINATGLDDKMREGLDDYPLLQDLFNKGYLNLDPAGGVSLSLADHAAISPRYGVMPTLHPHGTLIAGAVYHNNSTTTIQRYAQEVVDITLVD